MRIRLKNSVCYNLDSRSRGRLGEPLQELVVGGSDYSLLTISLWEYDSRNRRSSYKIIEPDYKFTLHPDDVPALIEALQAFQYEAAQYEKAKSTFNWVVDPLTNSPINPPITSYNQYGPKSSVRGSLIYYGIDPIKAIGDKSQSVGDAVKDIFRKSGAFDNAVKRMTDDYKDATGLWPDQYLIDAFSRQPPITFDSDELQELKDLIYPRTLTLPATTNEEATNPPGDTPPTT